MKKNYFSGRIDTTALYKISHDIGIMYCIHDTVN